MKGMWKTKKNLVKLRNQIELVQCYVSLSTNLAEARNIIW